MKTEANEPIAPIVISNFDHERGALFVDDKFQGLTKREHMAIEFTKATTMGIIAASGTNAHGWTFQEFAKAGLAQADALIELLNKTP